MGKLTGTMHASLGLFASLALLACEKAPDEAPFGISVLPASSYDSLPEAGVAGVEALCTADEACALGMLRAAAVSPAGDVAFLGWNGKEPQLYLKDAATGTLTRLGRPGAGPGEYRSPWKLAFTPAGEVVALDLLHRRVRYSRDGSALATTMAQVPGGVVGAGLVNGEVRFLAAAPSRRTGDSTAIEYLAVDSESGERLTLASLPLKAPYFNLEDMQPAPAPYAPQRQYDVLGDGRILYTRGERLEIEIFSANGVRELRFGIATEPRDVTKADLQASLGRSLMGVRDSRMRRAITEQARSGEGAGRHPAITRLVAMGDGTLWVRESPREAQDSVSWVVFDAAHKPSARLLLAVDDIVLNAHAGRILISSTEGEGERGRLRWVRLSGPASPGAPR